MIRIDKDDLPGLRTMRFFGLHNEETKRKAALLMGKAQKLLSGNAKEDRRFKQGSYHHGVQNAHFCL